MRAKLRLSQKDLRGIRGVLDRSTQFVTTQAIPLGRGAVIPAGTDVTQDARVWPSMASLVRRDVVRPSLPVDPAMLSVHMAQDVIPFLSGVAGAASAALARIGDVFVLAASIKQARDQWSKAAGKPPKECPTPDTWDVWIHAGWTKDPAPEASPPPVEGAPASPSPAAPSPPAAAPQAPTDPPAPPAPPSPGPALSPAARDALWALSVRDSTKTIAATLREHGVPVDSALPKAAMLALRDRLLDNGLSRS